MTKPRLLSSLKNFVLMLEATGASKSSRLNDDELRFLVRAFFGKEKRRLASGAHSLGRSSVAEALNRQRFSRNYVQKLKSWVRSGRVRPRFTKQQLVAKFRHDPILDALLAERKKKWTPPLKRALAERVEISLERFSFLDNPEATLANIKKIVEVECSNIEALLHFRDEYCLDIGPYLVLGDIWPRLSPFLTGGAMNPPVQKVMEAVGLRKLMRMRLAAVDNLNDVWAFPVRHRTPVGQSRTDDDRLMEPQRDQMVADEFCDAIDDWLGISTRKVELTDEGRAWIQQIILELLDNAKRHSDPINKDGKWSIAGFMARRRNPKGQYEFRCYIGILSVGATIEQSLRTCAADTEAQIETYVARHLKSGLSAETLRTVFALQDGITRDADADAHGRGGIGFQEVMSLINILGLSDNPVRDTQFTIVSGGTCIVAKKPYMQGVQMGGPNSPRVLWFNDENSPEKPPDRSHVFDLRDRLAGSIISLAFTLDPDFLNSVVPNDVRN